MIKILMSIFEATEGSLSSKRVAGVFGWIVIHMVWIFVALKQWALPEYTDILILSDAGLLGLDSVTSIWKGKQKEE